jgi:hypothetical protein
MLTLAGLIMAGYMAAVGYLGWFVYHEIREELNFQQRYGQDWRLVYEQTHGSLTHAWTKIAISGGSLLAVGMILIWFCYQTASRRRKRHEF